MSMPPKAIPILTDLPAEDPRLGFEKYVSAIAAAIRGGAPAQFTIGLYGPWGKGKSSILRGIQRELEGARGIDVVPFDAWRYEKAPNLLVPLVWRMRQTLDKGGAMSKFVSALKNIEVEIQGVTLRGGGDGDGENDPFLSALDSLSKLGDKLKDTERIVVLIDDLDRCSPGRVMEVIESIRILMDVPGFVFVLAIDYDVLKRAIRARYRNIDADQFIEKIVQVPFRIPDLADVSGSLVSTIVPDWRGLRDTWFPGVTDEEMDAIAHLALRRNPRQIKRVVNSGMLARHISWTADSKKEILLLLASLAMQQRWPGRFQEMVTAIERWQVDDGASDSDALGEVVRTDKWGLEDKESIEGTDLKRFLERFLPLESPVSEVIDILRLASEAGGIASPTAETHRKRQRRTVDILNDLNLIPDGAELHLDLTGTVSEPMRSAIYAWVDEEPARGHFTWAAGSRAPLRWAYEPDVHWNPSKLATRLFELANVEQRGFNPSEAWAYEGRNLREIARTHVV